MSVWEKVLNWLNAEPGRKRGISALIFCASELVFVLGHPDVATAIKALDPILAGLVIGSSLLAFVGTIVGWLYALLKGRA